MLKYTWRQEYESVINLTNDIAYFNLHIPNYPSFDGSSFSASLNFKHRLDAVQSDTFGWFKSINSLDTLLNEIKILTPESTKIDYPSHVFYNAVFSEMNSIGCEATINDTFTKVHIEHKDGGGRTHFITISLTNRYPSEIAVVESHDLPLVQVALGQIDQTFTGKNTLLDIYAQFKQFIEIFQEFWEAMESFSANCLVIEPVQPRLSDVIRRIKITNDCSALLTFNPYNSRQCPNIEFRGSEEKLEKFREILQQNLLNDIWDAEVDIYLNILSVLDVEYLPSRGEESVCKDALLLPGECGICYEDRVEGVGASVRCDNDKCSSQYHQACLLQYLRGNPNHLRIKNAVMGKCPTCRESIGCTINV